jgi:hypothetical protein
VTFSGARSSLPPVACMFGAANGGHPASIRFKAMSCGLCAGVTYAKPQVPGLPTQSQSRTTFYPHGPPVRRRPGAGAFRYPIARALNTRWASRRRRKEKGRKRRYAALGHPCGYVLADSSHPGALGLLWPPQYPAHGSLYGAVADTLQEFLAVIAKSYGVSIAMISRL